MQLTDRSGVTDGEESENDFTTNGWVEGGWTDGQTGTDRRELNAWVEWR